MSRPSPHDRSTGPVETERGTNTSQKVSEVIYETSWLNPLEGHQVSVTLRDGSRLDNCHLLSASRPGGQTVWLFLGGMDVFLPVAAIAACREASVTAPLVA